MKLVDDPDYFNLQEKWFSNQLDKAFGVYSFENIAKAEIQFNKLRARSGFMSLDGDALTQMREALTEKGLKLLSNAIAAHKKRVKRKGLVAGTTKKLQADIDPTVLDVLNDYCKKENKDQAAVLTELISSLRKEDMTLS